MIPVHKYISILVLGTLLSQGLYSQEKSNDTLQDPMDPLGQVTDAFQENFFEALKQKAIENYELALLALNKAEKTAKSDENKAVVYFEMGKNHAALKQYDQAEKSYKQALRTEGDRLDILERLYDLYYQQKDYEKSIPLVQKLIPFDEDYKEDLANLYSLTKQYDKALQQLDELDQLWGESDIRNALRSQIYRATGDTQGAIDNLEQKIDGNPKNEREYLNLIFLYSEQGNKEKAFQTAKKLLSESPNSQLVHLALYKFYLDEGNASEAIKSMDIVFASEEVDKETKYRVLGDFIQYVNGHPQYEDQLTAIVSGFSAENPKIYEKLGDYYATKHRKQEALEAYEKGIALDPDNFKLLKNTLLYQIDFKKYEAAAALSSKGLEIFPAQALLYLLNGVARNGLGQSDAAIESLEMGLDFILDDPRMERDFYTQLSLAHSAKGNEQKAKMYSEKAAAINASN